VWAFTLPEQALARSIKAYPDSIHPRLDQFRNLRDVGRQEGYAEGQGGRSSDLFDYANRLLVRVTLRRHLDAAPIELSLPLGLAKLDTDFIQRKLGPAYAGQ
jgi:hypothetical protein